MKVVSVKLITLCVTALMMAMSVSAKEDLPKLVWAHYTAWHHPSNASNAYSKYYNFPLQRPEGSTLLDLQREIEIAQACGLNGFFVDIVAKEKGRSGYLNQMGAMLKAAEGTSFLVGPCLDVCISVDRQVEELKGMLDSYGSHPNFPKVKGRAVIATYSFFCHSPDEWQEIRDKLKAKGHEIFLIGNMNRGFSRTGRDDIDPYAKVCDMLYSFGEYGISGQSIEEKFSLFRDSASDHDINWMATIHPGYLGAWLNGRNDFYQPHRGFDQVLECWDAIDPSRADWIHLTTWNDHDETPLMPMSFEFGMNGELTQAKTREWRGESWASEEPRIYFAYHREEIAGTVWRLEALALPCAMGGKVSLSVELLDHRGSVARKLDKKVLSLEKQGVVEWNIPTADLASSFVLVPRVTISHHRFLRFPRSTTCRLPAFFPKMGWLQNQVTVKAPAHLFTDVVPTLSVQQEGTRLSAQLALPDGIKARNATLYRNDRPIAVFGDDNRTMFGFHLSLNRKDVDLSVEDGEIVAAYRKFQYPGETFSWNAQKLETSKNAPWYPIDIIIAGSEASRIVVTTGGTRFGMTMARAIWRAVWGTTAAIMAPSRK